MNSQEIEQKLAQLEEHCTQLANEVKNLKAKIQVSKGKGAVDAVTLDKVLAQHIINSDSQQDFISTTQVVAFLKRNEDLRIGYKSVAQSIQRLTGQVSTNRKVNGTTKRGYCFKLQ